MIPFLPECQLPSQSAEKSLAGGVAKRPTLPIWHTRIITVEGKEGGLQYTATLQFFPFPLLEKNYVPFSLLSPFFPPKMFEISPPTLKFVSSIALSSSFSCLAVDLVAPKITLRERRRIGDGQSSEGACEDARYQG